MASIVIIDDQQYVRKLLMEEVTEMGYEARGFGPSEDILAMIRELEPDVVILDLYMGSPNGFDIFKDLKSSFPKLPIIIFTAYDSFRNDSLISQADAYIVKSSVLEPLKKSIARLLSRQEKLFSVGEQCATANMRI